MSNPALKMLGQADVVPFQPTAGNRRLCVQQGSQIVPAGSWIEPTSRPSTDSSSSPGWMLPLLSAYPPCDKKNAEIRTSEKSEKLESAMVDTCSSFSAMVEMHYQDDPFRSSSAFFGRSIYLWTHLLEPPDHPHVRRGISRKSESQPHLPRHGTRCGGIPPSPGVDRHPPRWRPYYRDASRRVRCCRTCRRPGEADATDLRIFHGHRKKS